MKRTTPSPRDGYDIALYGISDGTFYGIHIPAIICIVTSFTCAFVTLVLSFWSKSYRTFFSSWSKSDRFVVYMAMCDGLFNMSHFSDHMHILIARSHVYPRGLCKFYGFMLVEFNTAQVLLVNIIAINAFVLIRTDTKIKFGTRDWRLLLWTFGAPFVGATIAAGLEQFGPAGSSCYFDGVKGSTAQMWFTTVPILLIFSTNAVLYFLTWLRIRQETEIIMQSLGTQCTTRKASIRAAQAMLLLVVAFSIQWGALSLFGLWNLITAKVPQPLYYIVVILSNIGGVLNLVVFLIIRRRQRGTRKSDENINTPDTNPSTSRM